MHPSHENTKDLFPFAIPNKVQDNAVFWVYETEDVMLDFSGSIETEKEGEILPFCLLATNI